MGGGRDKKKKAKNAAAVLASKKKADNKKTTTGGGVRRILQTRDDDEGGVATSSNNNLKDGEEDDWDAILASYRKTSSQLTVSQLLPLAASDDDDDEGGGIFPKPPRGNFSWTFAPSNGLVYMFGGEYYNGVENVVFDELLCWSPPPPDDDKLGSNTTNNKSGRWKRILTPPPHPPPRCAHSAVYYNAAIYIFGGENVTTNIYHHYRDLWKFDIQSNTWTELRSSKGELPPPSARSGHRAIIYQQFMLLFGGFFESTKGDSIQFYNDIHVYDIVNHNWKEIKFSKLARLPPPRSACNLGLSLSSFSSSSLGGNDDGNEDNIKVGEDVLVVYGGYSKVKNVTTTTNHQIEQHHQKGGGSSSASNMRKSSSSEGIVHVDTWILPLKYIINSVTSSSSSRSSIPLSSSASWERIPRKGEYPSTRAGTTSIMLSSSQQQQSLTNTNNNKYNNCMIVFGGVIDNEGDHHIIESIFYNDLFIFDMDCKRWMSVQLLKDNRAKQDEEDDDNVNDTTVIVEEDSKNEEVKSNGFGLTELRQDMFAFTDGEGNVVFENIDGIVLNEEEGEDDEVEMDKGLASVSLSTTSEIPDTSTKTRRLKGKKGKGKKIDLKKLPPVLSKIRDTPLPRINCASIIRNNTLYIYGGLVEVGDREVTLDDCWSIDLNKCDKKWNCIYPGRMHKQVWKGVDSDNDSYISSDQGADDDADSDDDDVAEFEPILEADADVDDDDNVEESKEEAEKRAKKEAKKAKDKEKRRAIRNEGAELKEQLDDDNEVRKNPLLGESAADFYTRMTQYWDEVERLEATNQGKSILTKDTIECEGHRLANIRYDEVKHIRERLDMLERLQLEYDEKKAKKKTDKKLKKDRLRLSPSDTTI